MKREDFENTGWVSITTRKQELDLLPTNTLIGPGTFVGDLPENVKPPLKPACSDIQELRKQIAEVSARLAAMSIRLESLETAHRLTQPIGSAQ